MKVSLILFCFSVIIYTTYSTQCSTQPFGEAGIYNLYSLSTIYGCNSDVQGRVAANGPIFYTNYDVGLLNQVSEMYSLVSSSTIDFTSGSVWHGGVIGGDVSNIFNVGIMDDGTANLSDECCNDTECDLCVSTDEASLPIDFDTTSSDLLALSLYWLDLPQTSGATVEYLYQGVTLTCSSDDFNHFVGVDLNGITSATIICHESATVLIDYTIETVSATNMDFIFEGGITSSQVIHHFCGPTLEISGVHLEGTVFAPWSDVFFSNGLITGSVFAGAFVGSNDVVSEISAADSDSCAKFSGGHAITTDATGALLFDEEPQALFVQTDDGTATITGVARSGDVAFDVEVTLSGYSSTPPPDSPKLELLTTCYVSDGGSIDPATWEYYEDITGTFTGTPGSTYEGAVIEISRMGPSAQVGYGANGKNVDDGLSFWFTFETIVQSATPFQQSGYGDFNLDKTVIEDATCPDGQINRDPFDGCVPTMQEYICCEYQNGSIINSFCAEDSCVEIVGWNLIASHSVSNCESCTCPTA